MSCELWPKSIPSDTIRSRGVHYQSTSLTVDHIDMEECTCGIGKGIEPFQFPVIGCKMQE